jgi:hypothetical protein
MPGATDLYFRVADNEAELAHLRSGALATIPSIWVIARAARRASRPIWPS